MTDLVHFKASGQISWNFLAATCSVREEEIAGTVHDHLVVFHWMPQKSRWG